ncbi:hypothetical protein MKW98_006891 [Papaver atlanticum]|uniref:Uncharacterized protein n=1 Tax=Papaver atlanticum TaxID=357466 RepID=A0AAD4SSY9_9MAGN|nr:hypothetical protein MKW98_006891 [Papaver atlanticum]
MYMYITQSSQLLRSDEGRSLICSDTDYTVVHLRQDELLAGVIFTLCKVLKDRTEPLSRTGSTEEAGEYLGEDKLKLQDLVKKVF